MASYTGNTLIIPAVDIAVELTKEPYPMTGYRVVSALAICQAESSRNAYAAYLNTGQTLADGRPNPGYLSLDLGLFQHNTYWHGLDFGDGSYDPETIATAMLWKDNVLHARRLFNFWLQRFDRTMTYADAVKKTFGMLWTTYSRGLHQQYVGAATTVCKELGII
jgi:hypothetical protein